MTHDAMISPHFQEARSLTPPAAIGAALAGALLLAPGCAETRSARPPASQPRAAQDVAPLRAHANLFLFGPLSTERFLQISEAGRSGTVGIHNVTGRPHGVEYYHDLIDDRSNPLGRTSGDLLLLLLTLEPEGRLPAEYEELLPAPWPDMRSRLEHGETFEALGSAHDLRVLALAAPTSAELEPLIDGSRDLPRLLGGALPAMTRLPSLFLIGSLSDEVYQRVIDSCWFHGECHRPHDIAFYRELFEAPSNPCERRAGDLLVLLLTLEPDGQVPEPYGDLLPLPWSELRARLESGETVEQTGSAHDLKTLVLAAPTRAGLETLVQRSERLRLFLGGKTSGDHGHEHEAGAHTHESARPDPLDPSLPRVGLPSGSRYVVGLDAQDRRTASVRMELAPAKGGLVLAMSEGARHVGGYEHFLRDLAARDADGRALTVHGGEDHGHGLELDGRPVTVEYQVALEHDASHWPEGGPDEAPYATADDVFWTGRALFLLAESHGLEVEFRLPPGWRVSTPWAEVPGEPGVFQVPDEDELAESFVLAGTHAQIRVQRGEAEILLAVGQGVDPGGAELREVVEQVLDAGRELFGGTPPGRKLLVANLGGSSGSLNGGVFGNSISLLTDHAFTRDRRAGWAPFVAHEIVHLWNGGAALHASGNAYWFSEGFTEYYAHVLGARLGFLDRAAFLERVRSACVAYLGHAGSVPLRDAEVRELQYDGGFLAALTLDLRLRQHRPSSPGLDQLMHEMFVRYGTTRRYSPEDVGELAAELAGDDLERFFERHVAGTELLPLERDLAALGLRLESTVQSERLERGFAIHEVLHIRSLTRTDGGLLVRKSSSAGYQDGDLLLAIDGRSVRSFSDVQTALAGSRPGQAASLRILRDGAEITWPVTLGGREDPPLERAVDVRLDATGDTTLLDRILDQ